MLRVARVTYLCDAAHTLSAISTPVCTFRAFCTYDDAPLPRISSNSSSSDFSVMCEASASSPPAAAAAEAEDDDEEADEEAEDELASAFFRPLSSITIFEWWNLPAASLEFKYDKIHASTDSRRV